MSLYEFDDYKVFFNSWVEQLPKAGHGEYRRLAQTLRVSTTMISQVFNGPKHLSLELACEVCDYLKLNDEEAEYFLLLVDYARAGSHKLRTKFQRLIKLRQEKAKKIENRVKKDFELSEQAKSVFYASWIYSAVRLLSAVPEYQDIAAIAQKLNLPRHQVQNVAQFLVENGLCAWKEQKLVTGNVATHIGSSHLLVTKHHQNWRLHGFQKMVNNNDNDLFFTLPCALSAKDREVIRAKLLEWIVELRKIIGPSDSEVVQCLNIDWFEI